MFEVQSPLINDEQRRNYSGGVDNLDRDPPLTPGPKNTVFPRDFDITGTHPLADQQHHRRALPDLTSPQKDRHFTPPIEQLETDQTRLDQGDPQSLSNSQEG